MGSVDQLEDKIDRLENRISDLRSELHVYEAENIELEMEATQMKNENDDLHAEVSRYKKLQAKTEADRRKSSAKYNNLLDDLSVNGDDLTKELAYYRRKSDDLEESLKEERKMWQSTMKTIKEENDDYRQQKKDLQTSIDDKEVKLEDERRRTRDLEEDIKAITKAKEDAERAFREQERKTVKLLNEHTGLGLKVQDMYSRQERYKKRIQTMSSSNPAGDEKYSREPLRKMEHDDDADSISYYDDRSQKEDDYKSIRREDDRRSVHYETRGRSPTPDWG